MELPSQQPGYCFELCIYLFSLLNHVGFPIHFFFVNNRFDLLLYNFMNLLKENYFISEDAHNILLKQGHALYILH